MKKLYLVGRRFTRLFVIGVGPIQNGKTTFVCLCDCGATVTVLSSLLLKGNTKSCGCFRVETTSSRARKHGYSQIGSRTYRIWINMKSRCNNPQRKDYPYYGGRGIQLCQQWNESFESFLSDMGECPPGMEIDRIVNSKGYEPGNCEWKTRQQQMRNTRCNRMLTIRGVHGCLAELCEHFGMNPKQVIGRWNLGWTEEDAFFKPKFFRPSLRRLDS